MSRPQEICSLVRQRDERGLRMLFEHYAPALNGAIMRIVRNEQVAEEVLQDTLLKIWNKIEQYDASHARFFTWMMGIARNAAIDRARLKGFQVSQQSESYDAPVHETRTDHIATASIDVKALTAGLDDKYVDVLQKMYLEGYSTSATAEALNLPLGTVKTRIRTALNHLREKVKDDKRLTLGSFFFSLIVLLLLFLWTSH